MYLSNQIPAQIPDYSTSILMMVGILLALTLIVVALKNLGQAWEYITDKISRGRVNQLIDKDREDSQEKRLQDLEGFKVEVSKWMLEIDAWKNELEKHQDDMTPELLTKLTTTLNAFVKQLENNDSSK